MSSVSSLRRRVERLQLELAQRQARAATYEAGGLVSTLPTVDNWPSFAQRTWIRTSGTVAPFDPYSYQIDLINSINANPNTIVNKSRQTGVSETV